MATIIKADGTKVELDDPSFDDLQKAVGGYVELVRIPLQTDYILAVNEEGVLRGLTHNAEASKVAGQPIVGDAVVVHQSEVK